MSQRQDREADAELTDEQLAKCERAEVADKLNSPVPTQVVSNGEYMPPPQSAEQRRVEARVQELAGTASKKLGMSRRQFLASTGGMAAAFLAMNEVYGRFFNVSAIEMFEPEAYAATSPPANLFTMDVQIHMIRGTSLAGVPFRALAQGPSARDSGFAANPFNPGGLLDELGSDWSVWNPKLVGKPVNGEMLRLVQFIKDVFFDSQLTVGVVSNMAPGTFTPPGGLPRAPRSVAEAESGNFLSGIQTAAVRNWVNELTGSRRLLGHAPLYPGVGNLEYLAYALEELKPDAWKGYPNNRTAKRDNNPDTAFELWSLDDEELAYPAYDFIARHANFQRNPGQRNICVHQGFVSDPPTKPKGHPSAFPKAARDWPHLNFIIYHSCFSGGFGFQLWQRPYLDRINAGILREGVPDLPWTTEFGQLLAPYPNVYAELGATFGTCIVSFPTVAAHLMGQLMKYLGPDRICFGTDCIFWGGPQWQIEGMWRLEIPEEMRRQYGYPQLTQAAKRKILGLNSAKLYGVNPSSAPAPHGPYKPVPADYEARIPSELKTLLEFPGFVADGMSKAKQRYLAEGASPSNTRWGWVRTEA